MLRDLARETMQYASLKHLYLSGTLVDEADTPPWRVRTPNRSEPPFSCRKGEMYIIYPYLSSRRHRHARQNDQGCR